MNLKEIEKVVASIQGHLFRNSNSFSIGMLKSHFRGAGLQFKEHQVYNPGDDVRFIDWKLSAKTNTTYVKTFEEERNVEIYTVLDLSESMLYGHGGVSKLQAAIEIICLLLLISEKSKDKIAPVIISDEIKILPLSSGHQGIVIFIDQLERLGVIDSSGRVNPFYGLEENDRSQKKMGLFKSLIARGKEVVYLGDFSQITDIDTFEKLIKRHNMHCFRVLSPLDLATKVPFSILGKVKGHHKRLSVFSNTEEKIKGKHKVIKVDERYLESFIREML